jgi:hypothetical protein
VDGGDPVITILAGLVLAVCLVYLVTTRHHDEDDRPATGPADGFWDLVASGALDLCPICAQPCPDSWTCVRLYQVSCDYYGLPRLDTGGYA